MSIQPEKTKILYVITKSNFGGAQRYVYDLATGLPGEKFDVAVAVGGKGALVDMLHSNNIRVIAIQSLDRDINILKELTSFFTLWNILRKEKPDVVHLNSAKASGLGALSARLLGVPKIIFTAHGWAFNESRPPLQRLIIKFLSWVTIMLSHNTISVSDAVKITVQKWPLISKKIITIKNGVKEPNFYTREIARNNLYGIAGVSLPRDATILGTVAELHRSKGLKYAIEGFARLSPQNTNIYYFIIGGGDEDVRLQALVEHHKLQGHVFLLGFVKDAPYFLRAFDMFILPSTTEALGLVILEAGLAGLPVIATDVGGIPEIIENEKTGLLIESRNPVAIAESIMLLKNNASLSKKIGESLRERVVSDFSLDCMVANTIALYKKNGGML